MDLYQDNTPKSSNLADQNDMVTKGKSLTSPSVLIYSETQHENIHTEILVAKNLKKKKSTTTSPIQKYNLYLNFLGKIDAYKECIALIIKKKSCVHNTNCTDFQYQTISINISVVNNPQPPKICKICKNMYLLMSEKTRKATTLALKTIPWQYTSKKT